jgi:hypothetical protein
MYMHYLFKYIALRAFHKLPTVIHTLHTFKINFKTQFWPENPYEQGFESSPATWKNMSRTDSGKKWENVLLCVVIQIS